MNENVNRVFHELISGQLNDDEYQKLIEELTPEERVQLGVILFERMRLVSQALQTIRGIIDNK